MNLSLDWRLGTVGFGYKDWVGPFYPTGAKPATYLNTYAQSFNAVELDTTFYGPPDADKVRRWANTVPVNFIFCPKTPRRITHDLRLTGPALIEMHAFLSAIREFEHRLGPILIQFPPDFSPAESATLSDFLRRLPAGLRYAIEFRHRAWYDGPAQNLLPAFNIAWVTADYPTTPRVLTHTADFLYLRFLGEHGKYQIKTHEREDRTADLQFWWQQLQPALPHVTHVYGFFNNDYSGFSPATCNRFKQLVGLPTTNIQPGQQLSLF
mgnify:CR=1 FL=1